MLQLLHATAFATASPPIPLDLSTWANKRVLFITAHPDDVEGFAGGLARSLFLRGDINTTYLIATSGNAGGSCYTTPSNGSAPQYDPTCEKEELALVRSFMFCAPFPNPGLLTNQIESIGNPVAV